jgi:GNAT superfamily N-acetyltransferase
MASTEFLDHPLGTADLDGLMALSRAAHWNQDEADWRYMLSAGHGWGCSLADGTLVASTVVLPYGAFAWVSMVLVLPAHRRRGHASRLLRVALDGLAATGTTALLDATPAGHAVYVQEGFVDTWGFARLRREAGARHEADPAAGDAPPPVLRPLGDTDWPAVAALDGLAFGADRCALLRSLAGRLPGVARVAEVDGAVAGFVLARPGREATQLGPLVATQPRVGLALADAALAAIDGPIHADVPDTQTALLAALHARGFSVQRPFTRMVHVGGRAVAADAPGDASRVMLVAGPELG